MAQSAAVAGSDPVSSGVVCDAWCDTGCTNRADVTSGVVCDAWCNIDCINCADSESCRRSAHFSTYIEQVEQTVHACALTHIDQLQLQQISGSNGKHQLNTHVGVFCTN